MKEAALLKAIRIFGTQASLASAIGITPQHLNNWLNRDKTIPYEYAIIIEDLTNRAVKVEQLTPHQIKANTIIKKWGQCTPRNSYINFLLLIIILMSNLLYRTVNYN